MNNQRFIGMVDLVNRVSEGKSTNDRKCLREYLDMVDSVQVLETTTETIREADDSSKALVDKREEYMKDLKDREDYFKDKYGDEWESVMYGTATNLAKKDLGMD